MILDLARVYKEVKNKKILLFYRKLDWSKVPIPPLLAKCTGCYYRGLTRCVCHDKCEREPCIACKVQQLIAERNDSRNSWNRNLNASVSRTYIHPRDTDSRNSWNRNLPPPLSPWRDYTSEEIQLANELEFIHRFRQAIYKELHRR